jgi:hypothetical protein
MFMVVMTMRSCFALLMMLFFGRPMVPVATLCIVVWKFPALLFLCCSLDTRFAKRRISSPEQTRENKTDHDQEALLFLCDTLQSTVAINSRAINTRNRHSQINYSQSNLAIDTRIEFIDSNGCSKSREAQFKFEKWGSRSRKSGIAAPLVV